MDYLIFDLWPKEIMKLWSIWSGGRSPSKIYQNQSLINFDEFLKCVDTYPRWASLIRQLMIGCLETTSLGPWHVVASMTACYDSLDCLWGSLSHRFSNEEEELVWHVRWISDVSFYIALFWIGTTTGCTFSVCRFQTCDVLLAQQSTDSVRHGTVPQFNQLIKCNVAMHSTASAKHFIQTLFICFEVLDKVELSDLICN